VFSAFILLDKRGVDVRMASANIIKDEQMKTFYLLRVLLQTMHRSLTDIVSAKHISKDVVTGLLLRAIMDDDVYVARQEKPCPAICIESLWLYSDGKLYSPYKQAVLATLDAKSMECIENAMIDRAERKVPNSYTQKQKIKTLIKTTKEQSRTR
jgi:hypothetical protein